MCVFLLKCTVFMPEIEIDIVILFVTLLAKTVEVIANQFFVLCLSIAVNN